MGFWDSLNQFIQSGLTDADKLVSYLPLIAGFFTTLAAGISLFTMVVRQEKISRLIDFTATTDLVADTRLSDLRKEFGRSQKLYRMSNVVATLLTFSQFIVGGLLAATVFHEMIPTQTISWLGILVLVSQLIHQKFRPDLLAGMARQRMSTARRFIREIEDKIYLIENEYIDAPEVFAVRVVATKALANLDEMELEGHAYVSSQIDTSVLPSKHPSKMTTPSKVE
ncbi:hypothetical protein [Roseibium sp. SCP14]|uniref:hypothetical protein n=1 Tax=Roseibium sp. SCP14 TaxID=3141375 RepID=UPI003335794B